MRMPNELVGLYVEENLPLLFESGGKLIGGRGRDTEDCPRPNFTNIGVLSRGNLPKLA